MVRLTSQQLGERTQRLLESAAPGGRRRANPTKETWKWCGSRKAPRTARAGVDRVAATARRARCGRVAAWAPDMNRSQPRISGRPVKQGRQAWASDRYVCRDKATTVVGHGWGGGRAAGGVRADLRLAPGGARGGARVVRRDCHWHQSLSTAGGIQRPTVSVWVVGVLSHAMMTEVSQVATWIGHCWTSDPHWRVKSPVFTVRAGTRPASVARCEDWCERVRHGRREMRRAVAVNTGPSCWARTTSRRVPYQAGSTQCLTIRNGSVSATRGGTASRRHRVPWSERGRCPTAIHTQPREGC